MDFQGRWPEEDCYGFNGKPRKGCALSSTFAEFELDRRRPVADQVFQALKEAIVGIELQPGASISESTLGKQFGVSRTPIRAAIAKLADEGLVDVYPQQGSFVTLIDLTEVTDCHFVRKHLELAILREAAAVWSADKSRKARAIIDAHAKLVEGGNTSQFHAQDELFHRTFSEFANRPGVWDSIRVQHARLERFRRLLGSSQRLPQVIAEHTAIVDALDAGDVQLAVTRMEDHLDKVFVLLDGARDRYQQFIAS